MASRSRMDWKRHQAGGEQAVGGTGAEEDLGAGLGAGLAVLGALDAQGQVGEIGGQAAVVEPAVGVERGAEERRQGEGGVAPEVSLVRRGAGELLEREGLDRGRLRAVGCPQQEAGQGEAEVGGLGAAAEVSPALIRGRGRPVVRVGRRGEGLAADEPGAGRPEERGAGQPCDLAQPPEQGDIPPGGPNARSATRKVQGRPPPIPTLGSTRSLYAAVVSMALADRRSASSSPRVASISSSVSPVPVSSRRVSRWIDRQSDSRDWNPGWCRMSRRSWAIAASMPREELGLARVLAANVGSGDLLQECAPGAWLPRAGGSRGGRRDD